MTRLPELMKWYLPYPFTINFVEDCLPTFLFFSEANASFIKTRTKTHNNDIKVHTIFGLF